MLMIYLSMIDSAEAQDKFERLYTQYRNLMMKVALEYVSDPALAEDCVHDAFLNILKNMDKIREPESSEAKALMILITRRRAIDQIRKRSKEVELCQIPESYPAVQSEEQQSLAEKIRNLPQDQQTALILKYAYGYSSEELASFFHMTPSGVRKLLGRAKNNLKKELETL